MTNSGNYDVAVIGAGQAAMPLIADLAKAGKRVALVERKHLGGSCANFGCTPTKAALASAALAHRARRAAEFGLRVPTVGVDFAAVLAGARALVAESVEGLCDDLAGSDNPALFCGHARLDGGGEGGLLRVRVAGGDAETTLSARAVVLDTGTRTLVPPVEGIEDVPFLDAGNWLRRDELPGHLVLLGGGYIGLEMAQFYRRMGSRVTVIEGGDRLLPGEEPEAGDALRGFLEAEGVAFRLGDVVSRVRRSGRGIVAALKGGDTVDGSHLFVATGRKPNTDDLGLDTVGVATDESGFVCVDEKLATTAAGVWAVGDVRGGPQFTNTSWNDYHVVFSQLVGDGSRTTTGRIVPYAIFTDPALARVGLTETEARDAGKRVKIGRYDLEHNGRARTDREERGFVKVVIDADTDRLLGATVLGDGAAEAAHVYVTLMNADAPAAVVRDALFIHPTLCEAVQGAVEAAA